MATPVLKIKRKQSGTGAPSSLQPGELAADITSQILYIGNSLGTPIAIGTGSVASGGVSSVALSTPDIFSVSGSPISSGQSGTLSFSLANQSQNTFFAGPINSTGTPSFRKIHPDDFTTGGTNGKYLTSDGANFFWSTPPGGSGGSPAGSNGQIQIAASSGFSSLNNFQILNNSSVFSTPNTANLITNSAVQNTTYSRIKFSFNNIISNNDIVNIKFDGTSSANYVVRNITNGSFKLYALPTGSGGTINTTANIFSSPITSKSKVEIIPYTNSSSPIFVQGTLKTSSTASTITLSSSPSSLGLTVGMRVTSGIAPIKIRGIILTTTASSSFTTADSLLSGYLDCFVDTDNTSISTLGTTPTNDTKSISGLLANNTYISAVNTSTKTITLSTNILGTFVNTDGNPDKINDTKAVVNIVFYPKGCMRPDTFITHIDETNKVITLNQKQHNTTDTSGNAFTFYFSNSEKQIFSFGTPLLNSTADLISNESISLIKQLNDGGRNLEQKILFKSPENYSISISNTLANNTTSLTLSIKQNLAEINVGDIVLYATTSDGSSVYVPGTLCYVSAINYNTGVLTLNTGISSIPSGISNSLLTLRSSRTIKSVIEHRSYPYSQYMASKRYNSTNSIKEAVDFGYSQGKLSYGANSFEQYLFDVSQNSSTNNLGSINDMGLYICSDTSIKIGLSTISRGANSEGSFIKEPIDSVLSHISIEPTVYNNDETINGIFFKNVPVITSTNVYANSNYIYVLGCRSDTPRMNDGFNYSVWYRLATTAVSTLVAGNGTNKDEIVNEITGESEIVFSLSDEVPVNTSLTVPLLKSPETTDLSITTTSSNSNINITIPESNTDVALSSGSIYITSGLDAGDVYVQSAEDIYLTSQTTRVSGNLIVDGYIQVANGIIGDATDGEEELSGLYLDGGSF